MKEITIKLKDEDHAMLSRLTFNIGEREVSYAAEEVIAAALIMAREVEHTVEEEITSLDGLIMVIRGDR